MKLPSKLPAIHKGKKKDNDNGSMHSASKLRMSMSAEDLDSTEERVAPHDKKWLKRHIVNYTCSLSELTYRMDEVEKNMKADYAQMKIIFTRQN